MQWWAGNARPAGLQAQKCISRRTQERQQSTLPRLWHKAASTHTHLAEAALHDDLWRAPAGVVLKRGFDEGVVPRHVARKVEVAHLAARD